MSPQTCPAHAGGKTKKAKHLFFHEVNFIAGCSVAITKHAKRRGIAVSLSRNSRESYISSLEIPLAMHVNQNVADGPDPVCKMLLTMQRVYAE